MARPPLPSPPAYVARAENHEMSRSQVAGVRRSMEDLRENLNNVQNHLLNVRFDETNVADVAEQFMAVARLRDTLSDTSPIIQSALPTSNGARLNERERQEITGLYNTGNYTQERLASHYGVSQTTIHNVVRDKDDNSSDKDDNSSIGT